MTAVRGAALLLGVSAALLAAGCGGSGTGEPGPPARHAPPPGRFLSVDAAARSVTITLIASYDGANGGFNFDGYSRELLWTVPLGWTVHVVCENRGPLRHSCAVVGGAGTAALAFPGASTQQPAIGIEARHQARFTFRATRVGVFRFACLVPGHEEARMWDPLRIVPGGKPSAVSLLARL